MATIHYESSQDFFTPTPSSVKMVCDRVLGQLGKPDVEIGVYFISAQHMCDLHGEYMDDPTLTDCITFPIETEDPKGYLGDVFIAPYAAKVYFEEFASIQSHKDRSPLTIDELALEVTRYLVHTLLHLCGYEDTTKEKAQIMRQQENEMVEQLRSCEHLLKQEASSTTAVK